MISKIMWQNKLPRVTKENWREIIWGVHLTGNRNIL